MKKFLFIIGLVVLMSSASFAKTIDLQAKSGSVQIQGSNATLQKNGITYFKFDVMDLGTDITVSVTNTGNKTCKVKIYEDGGAGTSTWKTISVNKGKTGTFTKKNYQPWYYPDICMKMTSGESCVVYVSSTGSDFSTKSAYKPVNNNTNNTKKQSNTTNNNSAKSNVEQPKQTTTVKNGWIFENHKWYYYKNGTKAKNEIIEDNGQLYYVQASGAMYTSNTTYEYKKIKSNYYLIKSDGTIERNKGWYKIIGDNAYVYVTGRDGKLAVNTTIDGYKIDKYGKWR